MHSPNYKMSEKVENDKHRENKSGIFSKRDIGQYGAPRQSVKLPSALKLLLIGKTGEGKSDTANTILGESLFKASDEPMSCTQNVAKYTRCCLGCDVTVVDTPGYIDTELGDKILEEIAKAITFVPDGYDAFIIILKYPLRWTMEAAKAIGQLETLFGKDFYRYCVIVFSFGDNFKASIAKEGSSRTFEDYIQNQDQNMGNLCKKANFRAVLFDNVNAQSDVNVRYETVLDLLQNVSKIKEKESGLYDNELFKVARELQLKESNGYNVIKGLVSKMKYLLSGAASYCALS